MGQSDPNGTSGAFTVSPASLEKQLMN